MECNYSITPKCPIYFVSQPNVNCPTTRNVVQCCEEAIFTAILNPATPQTIPTTPITAGGNLIPPNTSPISFPGVTIITNWQIVSNLSSVVSYNNAGVFTANKMGNYVISVFVELLASGALPGVNRTAVMQMYRLSVNSGLLERVALSGETALDSSGIRVTFTPVVYLNIGDSIFVTMSQNAAVAENTGVGRIDIKLIN